MSFWERFYPDERCQSAYDIPYERWYEKGIRGVVFDIDNTLVPHGMPADERAKALFHRLQDMGLKALVLSNNKEKRVKSLAEEVGCNLMYIHKADKPFKKGYLRAMDMLGTNPQTTLFVGDQIFTDVWGAKRLGIHNILTDPIHPKEEIQIVLKRKLEALVLKSYEKHVGK